MNHPYIYVGCFISKKELDALSGERRIHPLEREITNPHVTFAYMPESVQEELFGELIQVRVIGYGCDDENEGYKVQLYSENPAVQAQMDAIPVPHITLSISRDGKAVNTFALDFQPIEPFSICGIYGGYHQDEYVIKDKK